MRSKAAIAQAVEHDRLMVRRLAILISIFVAWPAAAVSIRSAADALKQGRTLLVADEPICASHPLPLFYSRRDFTPAWTSVLDRNDLLQAIRNAGRDGLDPSDYHLAAIVRTQNPDDRDLLLSDAFFLLTAHLLAGRVDPISIEPTWCLEPRTTDLVAALETALELHDIVGTVGRMAPADRRYSAMRDALAAYRQIAAIGEWPQIGGGRGLRNGDRGLRVQQLSTRLVVSGDLGRSSDEFNAAVDAAVRRFQRVHGLVADGIVGARTRAELNVTIAERVRQLELNLERWRWLPSTLGDPHIMINVPEFSLTVRDRAEPLLSMRIVVGKDFHRTPVFSTTITQIVLSPYWNVPDSIASRELWPEERKRPGYLRSEHIEVRHGRLRQTPGPWNALGLIKFNMPNQYNVYLHDTPARHLFESNVRAFSHGCMRIEKPVELAAYLLRGRPEWPLNRIVAVSAAGVQTTVNLKKPVPVHVLYGTAFVADDGSLRFAPDIYQRDAVLDAAMRRRPSQF